MMYVHTSFIFNKTQRLAVMENKVEIQARFGKALLQLMEQKGLSLRKLALASELEYAQVQRISKGKVNLELTSVIALCKGLQLTPVQFFEIYESI
jgi:transcriptional regulator with XRE-family HTH domain